MSYICQNKLESSSLPDLAFGVLGAVHLDTVVT